MSSPFSSTSENVIDENGDIVDLSELMHGRKNLERRDSVTDSILLERQAHQQRIRTLSANPKDVKALAALGLGSKKRRLFVYKVQFNQFIDVDEGSYKKSQTGSGKK